MQFPIIKCYKTHHQEDLNTSLKKTLSQPYQCIHKEKTKKGGPFEKDDIC